MVYEVKVMGRARGFINLDRAELEHLKTHSWQELLLLANREEQKEDERRFLEDLIDGALTESVDPPPMSNDLIRILGFTTRTFVSDPLHYPHTARWYEERARRLREPIERIAQAGLAEQQKQAESLEAAALDVMEKQTRAAEENRDYWIRRGATNLTVANGALAVALASALLNAKVTLWFGQLSLLIAIIGMLAAGAHPFVEFLSSRSLHKAVNEERERFKMPYEIRPRPGEWELPMLSDKLRSVLLYGSGACFLVALTLVFVLGPRHISGYQESDSQPASQAPAPQSTPPAQELPAVQPE